MGCKQSTPVARATTMDYEEASPFTVPTIAMTSSPVSYAASPTTNVVFGGESSHRVQQSYDYNNL